MWYILLTGQGGALLDISQLNKELASLPLLTSSLSDSEEGLATPSNAKVPSPPSRSSLVSTATPVFELRPKTAKKTSKDYLLGMLSRECPSLTETPVHLATEIRYAHHNQLNSCLKALLLTTLCHHKLCPCLTFSSDVNQNLI